MGMVLNPLSSPTGVVSGTTALAWSDDGYLAVCYANYWFLALYRLDGNALTKLTAPNVNTGIPNSCAWSGLYVATGGVKLALYKRNGETLVNLYNLTSPGGTIFRVEWSGDYLVVSHGTGGLSRSFYLRSGDTLTKQTTTEQLALIADDPRWNEDLIDLITGSTSYSQSDNLLAVGLSSSPYLKIYELVTGSYLQRNISSPPTSAVWNCSVYGSNVVAFAESTPLMLTFQVTNGVVTRLTDPEDPPNGGYLATWAEGLVAVASNGADYAAPFIALYEVSDGDITLTSMAGSYQPGAVEFDPTGDFLVSGAMNSGEIEVFAVAVGLPPEGIITTTDAATMTMTARHVPLIYANLSAVTEPASISMTGRFIPPVTGVISFAIADAVFRATAWHNWRPGLLKRKFNRLFRLRITKTGFSDLVLPFSSVTARAVREDRSSSISAVVCGLDQLDELSARATGGRIRLDAGIRLDNGEAIYTELLNVPLATPRFDQGPKSGSLTLTGSGLRSLPAGKAVTMAAVQYRSFSDGKRLIKSAVDWNLSVTDTVSDNGSSWQVGEITYAVAASPPSESMTVMEMD